ncbi:ATP-binding sensor histidine kinase [Calothrix sp. PCC 6303]|uniref:trifunctional serine/threonine-protein kinase/ATP-binding protein/sensor histidine kinase n=1 Tax=Calothrix sp. PCC 6303 TaxID=1170562 RepID=UPI0002ED2183|nr:ATP-binding sensor histidine kinase [Calothrix sp. PCC 6303]
MNIYLPGYEINEQIYSGSKTLVCRAMRESDGKCVIVKLMRNEYPSFSELVQFRNQFIISKNLDIDGVVRPLSLETYNTFYALVMEDFGGISLDEYFHESKPKELHEFFDVAIQVVVALDALHRCRIIHKDIKPANILINPDTKQVKLIDFSIASVLPRETQQLKNPNTLEGTLAYISPEQTGRMNRGIDYRTDFYSLGVTFYRLLTQQLPFITKDPMELLHCHIAQKAENVTSINPDIPKQLAAIVSKLMAKNAEERYQSALGLKYDLERCQKYWHQQRDIPAFLLGQRDLCDRFIIPEKLYGREDEIKQLLTAFERVSHGDTEVMLLAGLSGIGKTAVVNEVHKPIVRQRGYFIRGKYDQFQRHIPFSAFVQSFRDLMGQLLSESDTLLQYWRSTIIEVLGENAEVIIDVIPELEGIIGKQPAVVELEGTASQNRFNLLFKNFIKIFATSEHPLVIFLDDLQWADSASLKLMQMLASETDSGHILIIGAYRDNEVSATHPLLLTLKQIRLSGTVVNEVAIAPLEIEHINNLVADTLNCSEIVALPLAQLIYQKTKGNPFFCTQFMKVLYEEGLLIFDLDSRSWECNISAVRERALTNDVVELITQILQKLPASTQKVLQFAACIGNEFDLNSLSIVLEKNYTDTATDLWKALQEELILPKNETYKFFHSDSKNISSQSEPIKIDETQIKIRYKFLHDRVQQAAYALIPETQKQETHLKIGRLLLEKSSETEREENIFDIVNHLNTGIKLIEILAERQVICELNLFAAKKAKAATAYMAAQQYLDMGINLLRSNCWEEQYEFTYSLYREKIEIEYLNGNFDNSEELTYQILKKVRSNAEKCDILNTLIIQYTLNYKFIESIKIGRDALKLLDINLPEDNFYEELQAEYTEVNQLTSQRKVSSLINLPVMESQEKIIAARLLMNLDSVAYIGMPQLFPIVALKLVKLSLQYGNTPESARGYSDYGVLLGSIFQNYQAGYEFGTLAINLSNFFNTPALKCRTYFVFASFINHWYKHVRFSNPINDDAYRYGLESGEFQNSGYSLWGKTLNLFCQGANLNDMLQDFSGFVDFSEKTHNVSTTDAIESIELVVRNLAGLTGSYGEFSTSYNSELEYINRCESRKSFLGLCSYKVMKCQVLYIYGDWEAAYEYAIAAKEIIQYVLGFYCTAVHNFYYSLTLVNKYENTSDVKLKSEYFEQLQTNQLQMKKWADSCPENFLHKYLLIEAEIFRVDGNHTQAMEAYDNAINLARENQYVNEEALAGELAAKFYLGWQKSKIAQVYLTDAYYAYARWGAKAKVKHLEQSYPKLLIFVNQTHEVTTTETLVLSATQTGSSSSSLMTSVFDLATVLKASQAVSSEIDLKRLLMVLMEVALENAGASKAALVLIKNGQMFVEAVSQSIKSNNTVHSDSLPLEESMEVPISVLNYVKNSSKYLLIDNTTKHVNWLSDNYIQQYQPQSLLCLPIRRQSQLVGFLYLENRNTAGVFTSDRIELLQLICSQAAISIENAQLYERSQDYAKELESSLANLQITKEQLEISLEDVKQIQIQLVQSEKMSALGGLVAGIAHEINNPIGCISGNIEPAEQYIEDLFEIINLYQSEHPEPSQKLRRKIDKADLEYINEDLPKLLASMKQSIDRIYNISVSLRTFSRSDTHKPIVCDIHECIDSTLLILRHRLKASELRPEIEVIKNYGDINPFACYPGQMNQVFMNLLANAIDALDESSTGISFEQIKANPNEITITTSLDNDKTSVLISLRDNGAGIPEDVKNKIFDHLFTTKTIGKGTGLGLAIARQIVIDKHGGSIHVNSSVNQGAEFVIRLPFIRN